MIRRDWIREAVEEHGPVGYLQLQESLLNGVNPVDGSKIKPVPASDFSIRALWEGLVGPVEDTLQFVQNHMGYVEMPVMEAVTSSAFPSAVGQLISRSVIDGYADEAGFIGDQLVSTMDSRLRGERIVGFTSLQGPKPVQEGMTYEESSFTEKYVTSRETKRGRLLSVTEEAVYFDQTGQILNRAMQLGFMSRQERERRIIRAVIDADSGEAVYQPSGAAEQLYSAGNNNLLSTATPLVDWTDIQEVLTFHATNITDDRQADDGIPAQPLVWMPRILLTATELAGVAARIVSAVEDRQNNMITGGMARQIVPGIRALSSPFIDNATDGDQWDDGSDWFLGDFQRQFKYKQIWPLQTLRAPAQNDEQFERDIVARFKVREYGDVVAVDERWVIKVNAA